MIKVAVTPEVNAISTLLMLLTLTLIIIAARLEARASPNKSGTARQAQ
jgi:spermidine/putrescine transport system permease protein